MFKDFRKTQFKNLSKISLFKKSMKYQKSLKLIVNPIQLLKNVIFSDLEIFGDFQTWSFSQKSPDKISKKKSEIFTFADFP